MSAGFGCQTAPEEVEVYNPAFDVTPSEFVTAIVTEFGIARPPFQASLQSWAEAGARDSVA